MEHKVFLVFRKNLAAVRGRMMLPDAVTMTSPLQTVSRGVECYIKPCCGAHFAASWA